MLNTIFPRAAEDSVWNCAWGNSSVSITRDPVRACLQRFKLLRLRATPDNGVPSPQYTWRVNSTTVWVQGQLSHPLSLQDNDVVTCLLTSSNCGAAHCVSSSVTMSASHPTWYQDADGDGLQSHFSINNNL